VTGIGVVTWSAMGYAGLLVLVAHGIDTTARRSHLRSERQRTGGFVYHPDHDGWRCPQDQWLWPTSFDPDNRVLRYRGSPTVCNSCPVKRTCTASDDGREVSRAVDSWPASEAARFHRGIACVITVLAVLWPLATALTVGTGAESLLLVVTAAGSGLLSLPLWSHLRRTAAVPSGVRFLSLDANVEERSQVARAQLRRRTGYASDRRPAPSPKDDP
jgi:hypothetical protein